MTPQAGDQAAGSRGTEAADPALRELDLMPTDVMVSTALEREAAVLAAVKAAQPQIVAAVDLATAALRAGGRLVYVGAGTAGRIAALDATELPPTYGIAGNAVVALVAGGSQALIDAREGDEDDEAAGRRGVVELGVGSADVVVGVSASGRTPYVLAALEAAADRGATTIAVVNNADTPLAERAGHRIEVLTGAELVVGSTRLKAGTAQKIVLNLVSTATMVRLGRTFGNAMIAAPGVNAKLRARAVAAVAGAAHVSHSEAADAIAAADGSAPVALVMLLTGVDPASAHARLAEAGGNVRAAVSGNDLAPV